MSLCLPFGYAAAYKHIPKSSISPKFGLKMGFESYGFHIHIKKGYNDCYKITEFYKFNVNVKVIFYVTLTLIWVSVCKFCLERIVFPSNLIPQGWILPNKWQFWHSSVRGVQLRHQHRIIRKEPSRFPILSLPFYPIVWIIHRKICILQYMLSILLLEINISLNMRRRSLSFIYQIEG